MFFTPVGHDITILVFTGTSEIMQKADTQGLPPPEKVERPLVTIVVSV
jgi:hypothetical protein